MPAITPTEHEVLSYFDSLCNWGKWGDNDQLGTLNYITPQKTKRAASLVDNGLSVSCARTISYEPSPDVLFAPPTHLMVESGEGWATGDKVTSRQNQASVDYFGLIFHGYTITHIDSLAHFFWQGKMYNGKPAHLVSTNLGATQGSVEASKDGITAKCILVDVPWIRGIEWLEFGEGVTPTDILEAEKRCGFQIEEGDILLVRTGQLHRRNVEGPVNPTETGATACQAACLPLFFDRKIAMLGSDTGNDVSPSGYSSVRSPIHQVGIVAMGLWILDNADLEGLAKVCQQYNRWEFMLSIGPLRIFNGTGSPVNPLAIF